MNYTYLLVNFFTILVPFLFSFHPKLQFHKTWNAFFPAVILTGIVFVVWDAYFTTLGVWGFNPQYLTGLHLFNLPVEEILFFLCIPYACVFTFHCLDLFFGTPFPKRLEEKITALFIFILLILGVLHFEKIYTATTFFSLALVLGLSSYVLKTPWLAKFYMVYLLLIPPFFFVNGILTGTGLENPIVWYNENEFMGLRMLTIPVEDIFYGMELILINLLVYRHLLKRKNKTVTQTVFGTKPLPK